MFRAAKRLVTHDAYIALCGAHAGAPGIITIAGTGSISFGRGADGRLMRAGGWGYVFGDEGGGFDLTRQALRAALRSDEGWGPPTALRDALIKETGAKDANDLMHMFYGGKLTRPRMAAMSRLVDETALAGDVIAYGILSEAAQQLAGITLAVRKRTFAAKECAPVAYIGGAFNSARLLERFRTLLERDGLASVAPPKRGPAAGALLEAYRMAGITAELSGLPEAEK
jgi:N-acetylglucosamine kinase-like BadF-type ATPase